MLNIRGTATATQMESRASGESSVRAGCLVRDRRGHRPSRGHVDHVCMSEWTGELQRE